MTHSHSTTSFRVSFLQHILQFIVTTTIDGSILNTFRLEVGGLEGVDNKILFENSFALCIITIRGKKIKKFTFLKLIKAACLKFHKTPSDLLFLRGLEEVDSYLMRSSSR